MLRSGPRPARYVNGPARCAGGCSGPHGVRLFSAAMVPVLLQLGPLTIYSFGAMMALGFLISGYVVSVGLGRKGMDPEDAWSIVLWAAIGGIAGSRVLAIIADWQTFMLHPIASIFSGSGFVWYGGLIGGFVSVTLFIARHGLRWFAVVDTLAPALAMGQAIGRIGC